MSSPRIVIGVQFTMSIEILRISAAIHVVASGS